MVYRGKPSAGCENCRKAKKRCTLEQPSCARCVKLRKDCSGYRDTSALQIQDESEAVRRRATKPKARQPAAVPTPQPLAFDDGMLASIPTPALTTTDSSSGDDEIFELPPHNFDLDLDLSDPALFDPQDLESLALVTASPRIPFAIRPTADDVATTHFFTTFTAQGHWDFLKLFQAKSKLDPCLNLAIRACGMAALTNVEHISIGPEYARGMYVEALGLLNSALRDPKRSKSDESLLAVAMLGYYENLVCDSKESIQSWKAHIAGATSLLRLRGPEQFNTLVGRILFRETRAQILITCIWDDLEPPAFMWDWQPQLEALSPEKYFSGPADSLTEICFDFARVRARIERKTMTDSEALAACNEIDRRMMQWSEDTLAEGGLWAWKAIEVPDSPNIWNGIVHQFQGSPAPQIWNTFRSIRILVTRSQEWLCKRFEFTPAERAEQTIYFRKVRRQMTDEICAGVPHQLGHTKAEQMPSSALMSAYAAIWPIFFAGTCALERLGHTQWESFNQSPEEVIKQSPQSAAAAQAAWLLSRLDYISNSVGLRWASGIASALRGDFTLHSDLTPDDIEAPGWMRRKRLAELEQAKQDINLLASQDARGGKLPDQATVDRLSKLDRMDHAGLLFETKMTDRIRPAGTGGMWTTQPHSGHKGDLEMLV
ncbi:hypothetical protein LTR86_010710 [Recurvomyces mirabilis]|nr:hypothetical protein LTR86_010710 [Recurvomyces mirabilis]